jgi:hypothetical protein
MVGFFQAICLGGEAVRMLDGIVDQSKIPSVISELEEMADEAPVASVGAIYILKNEMAPLDQANLRRSLVFEHRFVIPGGMFCRLRQDWSNGLLALWREMIGDFRAWLTGADNERFRDHCDRCFWQEVVPVITTHFGDLADAVMNTINEAIINYAEYSFGRFALRRRVHAHLFKTEGELAYAIIRPSGTRLRQFDPLAIKTRQPGSRHSRKRGWGHTLLMERALFISFDHEPHMRGMMIIIGPDQEPEA